MSAIDPQERSDEGGTLSIAAQLRRSRSRKRFVARAVGLATVAGVATLVYALSGGTASAAPRTPVHSHPTGSLLHHAAAVQHRSSGAVTSRLVKPSTVRPVPKPASTASPSRGATSPSPTSSSKSSSLHPSAPTPPSQPAPPASPATPLVNANAINPGFWLVKVPSGWAHTNCGQEKAGVAMPATCSYWTEGSEVDVWSNPADPMQRVSVTTCFYGGCGEGQVKTATFPKFALWFPVLSSFRISAYEIGFAAPAEGQPGQFSDDGVLEAAHMGSERTFPLVTVTTQIPPAQHSLATAILDSLIVEPPMHCGGK